MKRDMDLVRKVLLNIEETIEPVDAKDIKIEGFKLYEIKRHLQLLYEAKLITGLMPSVTVAGEPELMSARLTWEGHNFLDEARDERRWEKAKKITKEKAGNLSFDILRALLTQLMREATGLI